MQILRHHLPQVVAYFEGVAVLNVYCYSLKVIINGKIVEELPSSFTKDSLQRCIGCGKVDSFSYSGTIIKDKRCGSKVHETITPIKLSGVLESYDRNYPIIVGGQPISEVKRYSYLVKAKGLICTECASDYRTIEFQGRNVPIVEVDSKVIGQTIQVERVLTVEPSEPSTSSTRPSAPAQAALARHALHAHRERRATVRPSQVPNNHWLDVGKDNRRSRRASGKYGRFR